VQLERILVNSRDWVSQHVRPLIRPEGSFELVDELPDCTLEFDLFKISNALENLIENAVKFGNSKGTISLYLNSRSAVIAALESDSGEVKAIERGYLRPERPLKGASRNTMLVIEVLDDGIGIPTHEKQAIFQPFTQAANSPTRGVRGAGLGLAMAKRIVDAHGGEIFCRSAMEQGTAFYIAIPIAWQRSG
jgi:signal transduction histidine kinase